MQLDIKLWGELTPEHQREMKREELVLEATEEICSAMERRGVNGLDLSTRLGTGKSHVSQLLSGTRNMTLRTLSDVAFALRQRITIEFTNAESLMEWQSFTSASQLPRKIWREQVSAAATNDGEWVTIDRLSA